MILDILEIILHKWKHTLNILCTSAFFLRTENISIFRIFFFLTERSPWLCQIFSFQILYIKFVGSEEQWIIVRNTFCMVESE